MISIVEILYISVQSGLFDLGDMRCVVERNEIYNTRRAGGGVYVVTEGQEKSGTDTITHCIQSQTSVTDHTHE